jgi:hypothetical protein
MLGILPQDLVGSFDTCMSLVTARETVGADFTLLVLLVLIVTHYCAEERLLFRT